MLPRGLAAHPAGAAERQRLAGAVERALSGRPALIARLDVGSCGCDLARPRLADEREDERWLRERYRAMGLARDVVIRSLDRHRRGAAVRPPVDGWPRALAGFVAEHARNAGETLYDLRFTPDPHADSPPVAEAPHRVTVAAIVGSSGTWLRERRPVLVTTAI